MALEVVYQGTAEHDAWSDYYRRFLGRRFIPPSMTVNVKWPPATDFELGEFLKVRMSAMVNSSHGMPRELIMDRYALGKKPLPYDGRIRRRGVSA